MSKYLIILITAMLAVFLIWAPATVAWADIFQWEYINPVDPSQASNQALR